MATEFRIPELGENITEADIAEILVKEGDEIEAEQTVMELETEKAVVELPCPHAGKVAKVHVSEGDTVEVGTVVLTIEEAGGGEEGAGGDEESKSEEEEPDEDASDEDRDEDSDESDGDEETEDEEPDEEQGGEKSEPKEKKDAAPKKSKKKKKSAEESKEDGDGSEPSQPKRAAATKESDAEESGEDDRPPPPAGPATRRLARKLGVDLYQVSGSGKGGRIVTADVEAYVRDHLAPRESTSGGIQSPQLPDFSKFGPVERKKLSKLRRTSAAQLSTSWQVIPHVTQHDEADVTELESVRRRYMNSAGKEGPKITVTAIVLKACAQLLREMPHFNSSLDFEAGELILKDYFHIGVAVDTEHGLVVPVIRDADEKSILEIAEELTELAARARDRKLDMSDMQGGTFTITNLGGIGGTSFTPIVNHPEVAILGLSRSQKRLSLVEGELEERLILPLSLSYDHRVIDGADAARFIVRLSALLSQPFGLLANV